MLHTIWTVNVIPRPSVLHMRLRFQGSIVFRMNSHMKGGSKLTFQEEITAQDEVQIMVRTDQLQYKAPLLRAFCGYMNANEAIMHVLVIIIITTSALTSRYRTYFHILPFFYCIGSLLTAQCTLLWKYHHPFAFRAEMNVPFWSQCYCFRPLDIGSECCVFVYVIHHFYKNRTKSDIFMHPKTINSKFGHGKIPHKSLYQDQENINLGRGSGERLNLVGSNFFTVAY